METVQIDGVSYAADDPNRPFTQADLEETFASIAFGIIDAVILGPMRSEMQNFHEEDQSSSTFF